MARVLILSSYVASSRVGGGAQALALARLGIEPVLVPTVILGRHPGYGPPGGAAVEAGVFEAMIAGVLAQNLAFDGTITGHFSSAEQVAIAAETLAALKASQPGVRLVVDPVMGDADKGLYVREPVAEALAQELVPLADLVAPNAWELQRLSGRAVLDVASAVAAARALDCAVLVSSVPASEEIGVLHADAGHAWLARHALSAVAPKGTGDLLTVAFTAALIAGNAAPDALQLATSAVAEAVALAAGADELSIDALPTALAASPRVTLEAVHG
ncbi:MAG TPA: bifunctional hydroxymethylpyrimidine kinase/phosphomethylpyrimidine kinase [Caulobacteraceae bacterium]|jgi:pyridoxine kinase